MSTKPTSGFSRMLHRICCLTERVGLPRLVFSSRIIFYFIFTILFSLFAIRFFMLYSVYRQLDSSKISIFKISYSSNTDPSLFTVGGAIRDVCSPLKLYFSRMRGRLLLAENVDSPRHELFDFSINDVSIKKRDPLRVTAAFRINRYALRLNDIKELSSRVVYFEFKLVASTRFCYIPITFRELTLDFMLDLRGTGDGINSNDLDNLIKMTKMNVVDHDDQSDQTDQNSLLVDQLEIGPSLDTNEYINNGIVKERNKPVGLELVVDTHGYTEWLKKRFPALHQCDFDFNVEHWEWNTGIDWLPTITIDNLRPDTNEPARIKFNMRTDQDGLKMMIIDYLNKTSQSGTNNTSQSGNNYEIKAKLFGMKALSGSAGLECQVSLKSPLLAGIYGCIARLWIGQRASFYINNRKSRVLRLSFLFSEMIADDELCLLISFDQIGTGIWLADYSELVAVTYADRGLASLFNGLHVGRAASKKGNKIGVWYKENIWTYELTADENNWMDAAFIIRLLVDGLRVKHSVGTKQTGRVQLLEVITSLAYKEHSTNTCTNVLDVVAEQLAYVIQEIASKLETQNISMPDIASLYVESRRSANTNANTNTNANANTNTNTSTESTDVSKSTDLPDSTDPTDSNSQPAESTPVDPTDSNSQPPVTLDFLVFLLDNTVDIGTLNSSLFDSRLFISHSAIWLPRISGSIFGLSYDSSQPTCWLKSVVLFIATFRSIVSLMNIRMDASLRPFTGQECHSLSFIPHSSFGLPAFLFDSCEYEWTGMNAKQMTILRGAPPASDKLTVNVPLHEFYLTRKGEQTISVGIRPVDQSNQFDQFNSTDQNSSSTDYQTKQFDQPVTISNSVVFDCCAVSVEYNPSTVSNSFISSKSSSSPILVSLSTFNFDLLFNYSSFIPIFNFIVDININDMFVLLSPYWEINPVRNTAASTFIASSFEGMRHSTERGIYNYVPKTHASVNVESKCTRDEGLVCKYKIKIPNRILTKVDGWLRLWIKRGSIEIWTGMREEEKIKQKDKQTRQKDERVNDNMEENDSSSQVSDSSGYVSDLSDIDDDLRDDSPDNLLDSHDNSFDSPDDSLDSRESPDDSARFMKCFTLEYAFNDGFDNFNEQTHQLYSPPLNIHANGSPDPLSNLFTNLNSKYKIPNNEQIFRLADCYCGVCFGKRVDKSNDDSKERKECCNKHFPKYLACLGQSLCQYDNESSKFDEYCQPVDYSNRIISITGTIKVLFDLSLINSGIASHFDDIYENRAVIEEYPERIMNKLGETRVLFRVSEASKSDRNRLIDQNRSFADQSRSIPDQNSKTHRTMPVVDQAADSLFCLSTVNLLTNFCCFVGNWSTFSECAFVRRFFTGHVKPSELRNLLLDCVQTDKYTELKNKVAEYLNGKNKRDIPTCDELFNEIFSTMGYNQYDGQIVDGKVSNMDDNIDQFGDLPLISFMPINIETVNDSIMIDTGMNSEHISLFVELLRKSLYSILSIVGNVPEFINLNIDMVVPDILQFRMCGDEVCSINNMRIRLNEILKPSNVRNKDKQANKDSEEQTIKNNDQALINTTTESAKNSYKLINTNMYFIEKAISLIINKRPVNRTVDKLATVNYSACPPSYLANMLLNIEMYFSKRSFNKKLRNAVNWCNYPINFKNYRYPCEPFSRASPSFVSIFWDSGSDYQSFAKMDERVYNSDRLAELCPVNINWFNTMTGSSDIFRLLEMHRPCWYYREHNESVDNSITKHVVRLTATLTVNIKHLNKVLEQVGEELRVFFDKYLSGLIKGLKGKEHDKEMVDWAAKSAVDCILDDKRPQPFKSICDRAETGQNIFEFDQNIVEFVESDQNIAEFAESDQNTTEPVESDQCVAEFASLSSSCSLTWFGSSLLDLARYISLMHKIRLFNLITTNLLGLRFDPNLVNMRNESVGSDLIRLRVSGDGHLSLDVNAPFRIYFPTGSISLSLFVSNCFIVNLRLIDLLFDSQSVGYSLSFPIFIEAFRVNFTNKTKEGAGPYFVAHSEADHFYVFNRLALSLGRALDKRISEVSCGGIIQIIIYLLKSMLEGRAKKEIGKLLKGDSNDNTNSNTNINDNTNSNTNINDNINSNSNINDMDVIDFLVCSAIYVGCKPDRLEMLVMKYSEIDECMCLFRLCNPRIAHFNSNLCSYIRFIPDEASSNLFILAAFADQPNHTVMVLAQKYYSYVEAQCEIIQTASGFFGGVVVNGPSVFWIGIKMAIANFSIVKLGRKMAGYIDRLVGYFEDQIKPLIEVGVRACSGELTDGDRANMTEIKMKIAKVGVYVFTVVTWTGCKVVVCKGVSLFTSFVKGCVTVPTNWVMKKLRKNKDKDDETVNVLETETSESGLITFAKAAWSCFSFNLFKSSVKPVQAVENKSIPIQVLSEQPEQELSDTSLSTVFNSDSMLTFYTSTPVGLDEEVRSFFIYGRLTEDEIDRCFDLIIKKFGEMTAEAVGEIMDESDNEKTTAVSKSKWFIDLFSKWMKEKLVDGERVLYGILTPNMLLEESNETSTNRNVSNGPSQENQDKFKEPLGVMHRFFLRAFRFIMPGF